MWIADELLLLDDANAAIGRGSGKSNTHAGILFLLQLGETTTATTDDDDGDDDDGDEETLVGWVYRCDDPFTSLIIIT